MGLSADYRLLAIGDIALLGMSDAEQRAATDIYKKNRVATNADLSPVN